MDVFKQLLVEWIVECHISFHQVEESSFRFLLSYLAAVSASYTFIPQSLLHSANTVHSWTMQMFNIQRHSLIRLLNNIPIFHFSSDMWISGNHLALVGVVGHWIN